MNYIFDAKKWGLFQSGNQALKQRYLGENALSRASEKAICHNEHHCRACPYVKRLQYYLLKHNHHLTEIHG